MLWWQYSRSIAPMYFLNRPIYAQLILCCCISAGSSAFAIPPVDSEPVVDSTAPLMGETERWSIHGQATYMMQQRNNFNSPYSGQNSLLNKSASPAEAYSLSATEFIGTQLWQGAEVYWNGEMFQGSPFDGHLSGVGGVYNGELQKGAYTQPVFYTARAFLRQTIGLGGGQERIAGEANQLAGNLDKNRLVLSYGKIATLDSLMTMPTAMIRVRSFRMRRSFPWEPMVMLPIPRAIPMAL
jgi:hypothetical protein